MADGAPAREQPDGSRDYVREKIEGRAGGRWLQWPAALGRPRRLERGRGTEGDFPRARPPGGPHASPLPVKGSEVGTPEALDVSSSFKPRPAIRL